MFSSISSLSEWMEEYCGFCVWVCVYIQKMELPTIPPFALIKGQHSRHQLWSSSLRPIYVTNLVIPYNTLPPAQHHSFFNFKFNPFIYNQLNCIYAKKCSLIERVKVFVLMLSCFYQENHVQSTQNLTIGLVSTPTNTSTIFDEVWMRWLYCFDDPFDIC